MRIRAAVVEDAPAMGRVMVESFLSAHRGQMPDTAWQKRADEWTPEVSARGWARVLTESGSGLGEGTTTREVLLVAEDDAAAVCALASGGACEDDPSGSIAEIEALYVLPDRQRRGCGRSLLRAAAAGLADLGFTELRIGVLTANTPARQFYRAMGGREIGHRTFDEEGVALPGTVYGWADITVLSGASGDPQGPRDEG